MTPAAPHRLVFIDALRGLAAVAVVIYHVYWKNLVPATGFQFFEPVHTLFAHTNLGVHVFFVISGFVITHSIREQRVTPAFVGRFALRRSLRLDPPYWATIFAMIVLTVVSNHAQHDRSLPVPSVPSVLAHLVYAQGFLDYVPIVGVFWTLCYEIQFYLAHIVLVGVSQRIGVHVRWLDPRWLVFGPLWVLCALCLAEVVPISPAYAVIGWPYFFLGVAVNWHYNATLGTRTLAAILLATLALAPFAPAPIGVAVGTALAIHLVARAGKLGTWTLGWFTQYLGRISYSLYLVHMLVGTPAVRYGMRCLGKDLDTPRAVALTVLGLAVSIAAAHVMYVLVERPAHRLSQRIGTRRAAT